MSWFLIATLTTAVNTTLATTVVMTVAMNAMITAMPPAATGGLREPIADLSQEMLDGQVLRSADAQCSSAPG
jgi:hypothetical protein